MATIKDIADLAKVSSATVSRVLNYDTELSVSAITKKKIFEAAEALNYTKHQRHGLINSGKIALIQWYDAEEELADLYYLAIRLGIEKKIAELNLELVKYSLADFVDTGEYIGILALGKFSSGEIATLASSKTKLLFVDFDGMSFGYDSIVVDYNQGVAAAIDLFLENGHQEIGILAGIETTKTENQILIDKRLVSFRQKLLDEGCYNPDYVWESDFTVEGGYEKMSQLLASGVSLPTALFISSDAMAIGVMRALQESPQQSPRPMSLIGFNDISVAKYLTPALTTIKVQTEWLGELAVKTLVDSLQESSPVPKKITIASELVERQTVYALNE